MLFVVKHPLNLLQEACFWKEFLLNKKFSDELIIAHIEQKSSSNPIQSEA